jgi:signal transduction histidine kinase
MQKPQQLVRIMEGQALYGVLVLGFSLQLILIVTVGWYNSSQLQQLSLEAQEIAKSHSVRVRQATATRAAIENVISEARAYRAARENLRVSTISFNVKLNTALKQLNDELGKARRLRTEYGTLMDAAERQKLDQVLELEPLFFDYINEDRRVLNAEQEGAPPAGIAPNTVWTPHDEPARAAMGADSDAAAQRSFIQSLFYSQQNFLLAPAREWEQWQEQARTNLLAENARQQANAAEQVRARTYWTFALSALIALTTYLMARRQVKQIRAARNEAEEAESLTTSVLNSLRDNVLAINEQGAVFSINRTFQNDFHLTQREALHQDYRTLLRGLPVLRQAIETAAQRKSSVPGPPERLELQPNGNAGDTRLFDLEVAPRYVGEERRGQVIVLTDVTEIERTREEAERHRALSRIGQLTAQVGHEIYNPLGALKLNADLLEMQLPPTNDANGDARQTVSRLKRALEHLSTIVLDLRYLSRPREPERQPVELHALLDEVIELASERLQRAQIKVERAYAGQALRGSFDPLQLRKVFLNLLINAIEASPRASAVTLATRLDQEHNALVVSVLDRGSGMSPETKRRVFEAFYSTKQNGTGLGMMITHEIVKKHGGAIEVESEEGQGTTVAVSLPL